MDKKVCNYYKGKIVNGQVPPVARRSPKACSLFQSECRCYYMDQKNCPYFSLGEIEVKSTETESDGILN